MAKSLPPALAAHEFKKGGTHVQVKAHTRKRRGPASPATGGAEPYGNVAYADPGYQADRKKRYPIHTKEHAQAALSYINQKRNAGKYSPAQLAAVRRAIYAAAKKHGIDTYVAAGQAAGGKVNG